MRRASSANRLPYIFGIGHHVAQGLEKDGLLRLAGTSMAFL
jgi:hypothetical protein